MCSCFAASSAMWFIASSRSGKEMLLSGDIWILFHKKYEQMLKGRMHLFHDLYDLSHIHLLLTYCSFFFEMWYITRMRRNCLRRLNVILCSIPRMVEMKPRIYTHKGMMCNFQHNLPLQHVLSFADSMYAYNAVFIVHTYDVCLVRFIHCSYLLVIWQFYKCSLWTD